MNANPMPALARRKLLLLAALFLVPLAFSFYLYYGSGWRPGRQVNHGELIMPPRALPAVSLATPGGGSTGSEFLRGEWSLVYIGTGSCDERCRTALYTLRQVRLALGDKMDRVQRVFLYTGTCCEQPFFSAEHAGLMAASVDSAAGKQLLREFPQQRELTASGHIYVVDPLGNLMMNYPPAAPAKGMIEDLKRLLKLSHIG